MSGDPASGFGEATYEITDHTADIGIRATARDWEELLRTAARGMLACIGELKPAAGAAKETLRVRLHAATRADLLRDWLAEILFHVDQRRSTLLDGYALRAGADQLEADLVFTPYDPDASVLRRELKAVTYHQLRVDETPDGYVADVIFDI